jgi:hypothetical protein
VICSSCRKDLNPTNFSFKSRARGLRSTVCKACHSIYRKNHYLENKRKYIDKALRWNKKQGVVLSRYLFEILSHSPCVDCGEDDVLVLDFDHVHNKRIGIAEMYQNRYSVAAVQKELDKCVVRCANCHRRKTAKESKFWKVRMLEI